MASVGRVLGDRSTLRKVLDPTLAAVLARDRDAHTTSVHVVDLASGIIVHTVTLRDVAGPVELVFRDNWILCTYQAPQDPAQLSTVVSIELYESDSSATAPSKRCVLPHDVEPCMLTSRSRTHSRSPLRPQAKHLQVLSRSFTATQQLRILDVTRTELGITSYSALCVFLDVSSLKPTGRLMSTGVQSSTALTRL